MGARKTARRSTHPTVELLLSYKLILLPSSALKGHTYALKLKGEKTIHFSLIAKLCPQKEYRPEAKGRVVDTACAVVTPGQAKAPTTPTDTNIFHCIHSHTWCFSRKRWSSKESTSAGSSTSTRDVLWRRGYGSPSPGGRTPEQVPSAPPAPPKQLPPIAEEGESTAGEGVSVEGASSQGGGRVKYLDSESNLDNMTEMWPLIPPATHEVPAEEPKAGAAGVQKATPRYHRSPPRGPFSVVSTAAVATAAPTTAVPAVTAVTVTTAGAFPRSWGDLRGTQRFSASSPHCKADARNPSRGAWP